MPFDGQILHAVVGHVANVVAGGEFPFEIERGVDFCLHGRGIVRAVDGVVGDQRGVAGGDRLGGIDARESRVDERLLDHGVQRPGIGRLAVGDAGAVVLDHPHPVDAGRCHLVFFEFAGVRLEGERRLLLDDEITDRAGRENLVQDAPRVGFYAGHQALPPTRMSSTFSVA